MRRLDVLIPAGKVSLEGTLTLPESASGVVAFAHGSGSSRHSPRNQYVAGVLQEHRIATLLFDLLTPQEDQTYATRFDINLLTERLVAAIDWYRAMSAKALALWAMGSDGPRSIQFRESLFKETAALTN